MSLDVVPARLTTIEDLRTTIGNLPELAALIGELFAEGTLSFAQLASLARLPELAPHLADAVAAAPGNRR